MNEEKPLRYAPENKKHTPVLTVDYEDIDRKAGYGDATHMDIGQSTWSTGEFSAKIWRFSEGRISRQSEELPLTRVLDMAILVSSAIVGKKSKLNAFYQNSELKDALENFITENSQEFFTPKLNELRNILQSCEHETTEACSPNIFSFATSELSQDAMFAWLISWSDSKYKQEDPELHAVAVQFLRLITGINDLTVHTLNVGKQWEQIDIWAEINNEIFLIIEDKTGTTIHDNQLSRYKESVEKEYSPSKWKRCFTYIKTGNEPKSILEEVKKAGYQIILREDILKCLDAYHGTNIILVNYRDYLRRHEQETQSYKTRPVSSWTARAWEGFYKALEEYKFDIEWSYVSNPSGGFLGAWWHFVEFTKGLIYLQFEEGQLCFKISVQCDRSECASLRTVCHDILMEEAKKECPEIKRPNRFGIGGTMTIAKVESTDLFGANCINIESILTQIKRYETLVDKVTPILSQRLKQTNDSL